MATSCSGGVRRAIDRFLAASAGPAETDRELLDRYARHRDEGAFEMLVRRHGGMVLGAARRVLADPHAAEDVCQAAFLLLARKAASGRWQPSVANWLHRTAHLLAVKARTATARRVRREQRIVPRAPADPLAEITGRELLAILDEELLALPEVLREPLVLCYLEGATRDEAARRLGCPLSTLKKRLERGRGRLHAALTRRGVGLPAALGVTLLVGRTAAAVSVHFARKTAALAGGGVVPPRVEQLVNGGIGMTGWNKVQATLGALLLGGLLATAGAVASGVGDEPPTPTPPKPAVPTGRPDAAPEARAIKVSVLDPHGDTVAGANVRASVWTDVKDFRGTGTRNYTTDAAGVATVKLPKTFTILRLWAGKESFVTLFANWEQAELAGGAGVPAGYTFRLEDATTAGGRVVDEIGNPVVGAKVLVQLANDPLPARGDTRVRYDTWLAEVDDAVTTDAAGAWRIANVPDRPDVRLSVLVSHPDFVTGDWQTRPAKNAEPVVLKPGVTVRGRVTDPDGKPIPDAIVVHGDDPYPGTLTSTFSTDAAGRYRLPAVAPGGTSITVLAPGRAPQLRKVDVRPGLAAQDFRMAPGKPVRLRVVDTAGKPIPGASVHRMAWEGSQSITSNRNTNHPKVPDTGIPARADDDGVWAWSDAPATAVKVQISANGFAPIDTEVTGGAADRTVTLTAEHRITGTVTDAVTGKPIPAFAAYPVTVIREDYLSAIRYHAVAGTDGWFDFTATPSDRPVRLRIEAPGYRTQTGPAFRVGDDASRTRHFRLNPSPPVTGRVVDPDGRPAANAEVLFATPTEAANITEDFNHRTFTDAAGRFTFPDPGEPWGVIARTSGGVVVATFPADRHDAGTLALRPRGTIRGRFLDGGKPVAGATVYTIPVRLDGPDRPRIDANLDATTDADGNFEIPRVPPGPVCVRVSIGPWEDEGFRSGPWVPVELKPGQTVEVNLGSGGAVLTGRVKLTGDVPAGLDCTYSRNYLIRREPGITPPAEVAAAGFDVRNGVEAAWFGSAEGLAYLSTVRGWFVKLAADGSFRVSGVPAGEYDLAVLVYAKPDEGCLTDPVARRVVRVTVTPEDVTRGKLPVPEIAAEVAPAPAVGDTPALTFERPDGTTGTLAGCRGKYTVVYFWATWCGACKKQLPAVRELRAQFADKKLTVLGVSIDADAGAWRVGVKRLALGGPQGRLTADATPGVSGVPAYWLLDPDGKIVARASDPAELAELLTDLLK